MKININLRQYLAELFLGWKMFQTKFVEKIKTHILRSMVFFWGGESFLLWNNVENCGTLEQATDDNMAHAHCMITTATNTYSEHVIIIAFSTATMVMGTRLDVRFIRTLLVLFSEQKGIPKIVDQIVPHRLNLSVNFFVHAVKMCRYHTFIHIIRWPYIMILVHILKMWPQHSNLQPLISSSLPDQSPLALETSLVTTFYYILHYILH